MGRKWVLISVAVVLVLGVGGAVWWFAAAGPSAAAPEETPAPVSTEAGPQAAAALEALETDPESLLPAELVGSVDLEEAVPEGTTVEADPTSWLPSEAGGGVMYATLTYPDGSTADIAAVMVEEEDGWKVLQTIPVEDAQ